MATLQRIRTSSILSPKLEKEKALLLKRIGSLLEEGYSIKDSLKFIKKFEDKQSKEWIEKLQEALAEGYSLHSELEKIGYSKKICSQIYLASQYGEYGKTIKRCGEDLLKGEKLKKRLAALLSYPFLLLSFLFLMLAMMRFLILPNMENLFDTNLSNQNIYADFVVSFIYYSPQLILVAFLSILLSSLVIHKKLKKQSALEQIHFWNQWPFLKSYIKKYWTSFLFLEWGQLLKKGISFHQLVAIMSEEEASAVLRETGILLSREMKEGKSVKDALRVLPFFEKEALIAISHGENLGQLGIEMLFYAEYCEEELTGKLETFLKKIQPLIFIFIAIMIIAIYASMILPIYTMMEGI